MPAGEVRYEIFQVQPDLKVFQIVVDQSLRLGEIKRPQGE